MASPSKLSPPDADARGGVPPLPLPLDALYEILLRLPARDLCRLRAVCRPWRALLSDPRFVAAHAARHGPLIVLGYHGAQYHADHRNEGIVCDVVDLSGRVVKRVARETMGRAMSVQLHLVCIVRGFRQRYGLLDPATGDVLDLPEGFAREHAAHGRSIMGYLAVVAFGEVASTGEIKVLRLLDNSDDGHPVQLCEIVTLSDGSSHAQWRGKKAPTELLRLEDAYTRVVVDRIVYFLSYETDHIASFDLQTEDWRQPRRGPLSDLGDDGAEHNNMQWFQFSLATLSSRLVVVHPRGASIDLWFSMDFGKGLWVKQYSIQNSVLPLGFELDRYAVCPLLVLEDGRIILIYTGYNGLLKNLQSKDQHTYRYGRGGALCCSWFVQWKPIETGNRCKLMGNNKVLYAAAGFYFDSDHSAPHIA